MICPPCKEGNHSGCPSMPKPYDRDKSTVVHPTGLSEKSNKVQRSGLCPCQHKVVVMEEDEPKIIFSGIARNDDPDFGKHGECRSHELEVYDNGWYIWRCPDCGMSATGSLDGEAFKVVLAGGGEEIFGDMLTMSRRIIR